jgi:hypothetical protein
MKLKLAFVLLLLAGSLLFCEGMIDEDYETQWGEKKKNN